MVDATTHVQQPALTPELLAAYVATEVVGHDGLVWSGAGAVEDLPGSWVVTAENPFSELQDEAVNAAAMADLEREIVAAGLTPTLLVGRAVDHSWSEACFAVSDVDGGTVRRWGRERGQHAVFLLTRDEHAVVSCWSGQVLARRPRRSA